MEEIQLGVSKFTNIGGVTCYMNSILAILQQTPILVDYIIGGHFKEDLIRNCDNDIEKVKDSVFYNLYELLKASLENDNKNITPSTFRSKISLKDPTWGQHQHQDSQEFLNFLITQLENETKSNIMFLPGNIKLNEETNTIDENIDSILAKIHWQTSLKKDYSPVKLLFTGQFKNIVECSICNNKSNNYELFQTLPVSIPIKNKGDDLIKKFTLTECLDYSFKKEKLDKNNKINCEFCFLKNQSNKYNKIWKTPKILVIQIKRFLMNDYGIRSQKLVNKINFPISNFDISNYVDPNSPDIDKCNYNLIGVNNHISLGGYFSCNFGHYTSAVKNRYDNNWYLFDDSNLKKLETEEELISNNAYLLFYYRSN